LRKPRSARLAAETWTLRHDVHADVAAKLAGGRGPDALEAAMVKDLGNSLRTERCPQLVQAAGRLPRRSGRTRTGAD
jgi:hypothetical protein